MSSLSSASTLAQVEAAYDDNASYAEDGSVAKAKAFVTALSILLRRSPAEAGTRESHVRLSPELLYKQLTDARAWLQANDTGGSPRVTRVSFENSR